LSYGKNKQGIVIRLSLLPEFRKESRGIIMADRDIAPGEHGLVGLQTTGGRKWKVIASSASRRGK
jgi:hypothetical protein